MISQETLQNQPRRLWFYLCFHCRHKFNLLLLLNGLVAHCTLQADR